MSYILARLLRPTNVTETSSPWRAYRDYSSTACRAAVLPRRDWRTAGYPAPRALTKSEYDTHPLEEDDTSFSRKRVSTSDNQTPQQAPTPTSWSAHRAALRAKFPGGWAPPRKLSRDAMDGLRTLHSHDPETFSTPVLAEKFRISPEAVRRILRSRWQPSREQRAHMLDRERQNREDWIRQRRDEEREKQLVERRLEALREEQADATEGVARPPAVRGINRQDRLTFR
jgi:Neugrin